MPNPSTRTKSAGGTKKTRQTKATPKRRASSPTEKVNLSPALREEMIREAAYYRAEKRGFQGGDPLADWLSSEEEVNTALSQGVH
jgi:Protein of unknown function (DUF2934)